MSVKRIASWKCFPLFASIAAVILSGCSGDHYRAPLPPAPAIIALDPNIITQGDNVMVHASVEDTTNGCGFLVVDKGTFRGVTATLVGNPPYVQNGVVTVNVIVDPQAPLGGHSMTFRFSSDNGANYGNVVLSGIRVRCQGCPPPPILLRVYPPSAFNDFVQMHRGRTTIARFLGTDFLNNSPVVEFLTPGVSADPNATITVQHGTTLDSFDLPIVVAPDVPPGAAFLRVATTGGITETKDLNVVADPSYVGPPSYHPVLSNITPKAVRSGADVMIKCEGNGFGLVREVVTDDTTPAIPVITYPVASSEGNPDQVVVAKLHISDEALGEGYVKVRVKNSVTGDQTDDIRIFVAPPVRGNPAARNDDVVVVHRGGDCDLQIRGIYGDARDHLDGTTDISWGGIPGLTFSNTTVSTSGEVTTVSVHVHADFVGPLTGDEVTNLRLTNGHGVSNPFLFRVLP